MDDRSTLLVIQHVPWEGPHRILDACGSLAEHTVKPLAGQALPDHGEVAGAVVMGGPMSVDDTERHPGLAAVLGTLAPSTTVVCGHGDDGTAALVEANQSTS